MNNEEKIPEDEKSSEPTEKVEEIKGSADITITMFYTKTGVQIELDNAGEKTKTMLKWSELL